MFTAYYTNLRSQRIVYFAIYPKTHQAQFNKFIKEFTVREYLMPPSFGNMLMCVKPGMVLNSFNTKRSESSKRKSARQTFKVEMLVCCYPIAATSEGSSGAEITSFEHYQILGSVVIELIVGNNFREPRCAALNFKKRKFNRIEYAFLNKDFSIVSCRKMNGLKQLLFIFTLISHTWSRLAGFTNRYLSRILFPWVWGFILCHCCS